MTSIASNSSPKYTKTNLDSEKDEIIKKIDNLYKCVPEVKIRFQVLDKIGEGAFSSVFLAQERLPNGSLSSERYALKYLIPTSHPNRILMELKCLYDLRSCSNVVNIKDCIRYNEHIVIIMPYIPHNQFCDVIRNMTVEECRLYMKNLLLAISAVHDTNIIHRDIKPNNFLYNRENQRFALVDFGLAQQTNKKLPKSSPTNPASSFIKIQDLQQNPNFSVTCANDQSSKRKSPEIEGENFPRKKLTNGDSRRVLKSCSNISNIASGKILTPKRKLEQSTNRFLVTKTPVYPSRERLLMCDCYGCSRVCNKCMARKVAVAHRAGTPGFRPPEVLLKSQHQTTAVDIWASGIMFLCILSGRYPFFRAATDLTALAEIMTLIGCKAVKSAATALNKHILYQPENNLEIDLKSVCQKLQETNSTQESPIYPDCTYDLLSKLLDPNPITRITASKALKHPFILGQ